MNLHFILLNILLLIKYINGEKNDIIKECESVNKLLGKKQSHDCCLEEGIVCLNGHIVEM